MATSNKIQIKRANTALAPASLEAGELAFSGNTQSQSLFIGNPNGGAVERVGGVKFGHVFDATPGTLTANAAIITNANSMINVIRIGNTSVNTVANSTTVSTANLVISGSLQANGSIGANDSILYSDGQISYWKAAGAASAVVSGTNTHIQFNDSGVLGSEATFNYNKDTDTLSIANTINFNSGAGIINATSYSGAANNTSFVGSVSAANVVSNAQLSSNLSNYQTTAGLSANVATLTANNANNLGGTAAASYQLNSTLSANVATLTANNANNLGGTAAASYQLNSTLSANVATLTANNANNLGGTAAASYQLNSTLATNVAILTANNANNLGGQLPAYYTNATNIDAGTLNTARLPATANISTAINVGANVTLTTTQITVGNSTVNVAVGSDGLLSATGNASVGGKITVTGNATFSNVITVTGLATFSNSIIVTGDIIPSGGNTQNLGNTTNRFKDLFLSGATLTLGNTTISAAEGDLVLTGGLRVNTAAIFSNTIAVTGAANLASTIGVVGAATFSNTIGVTGAANVGSTLGVVGAATFSNTIAVTGNATFTDLATFNGNVLLGSDTSDVISFNGRANTSIIPNANTTYDLGSTGLSWKSLFANNVQTQFATIDKDLTVSGNLVVSGSLVTMNVVNLTVNDPLIRLAANNNTNDALDIGFFGNYQVGGGDNEFTGLFRDASDGVYKLFDGLNALPDTTVDTANASFTTAKLQAFLNSGALTTNATSVAITANSTVNVSIVANTLTLSSALTGVNGGTGLSSFTTEDLLVANSSNGFRKLNVGTDGYLLQVHDGALTWSYLDGGTF